MVRLSELAKNPKALVDAYQHEERAKEMRKEREAAELHAAAEEIANWCENFMEGVDLTPRQPSLCFRIWASTHEGCLCFGVGSIGKDEFTVDTQVEDRVGLADIEGAMVEDVAAAIGRKLKIRLRETPFRIDTHTDSDRCFVVNFLPDHETVPSFRSRK